MFIKEIEVKSLVKEHPAEAVEYILELQQRLGISSSNSGLSPSADPFKKKLH